MQMTANRAPAGICSYTVASERKRVCGGLSAAGWSHSEHREQEAELPDSSNRPAAPELQQPAAACRHPGKPT